VLGHAKADLPGMRHHLGIHKETARIGQESGQHFPAKHFQGAIHIANLRSKQHSSKPVITPGEKSTPPAILSIHPVAGREVMIFGQTGKHSEIGQIELAIGIGEGDEVVSGSLKAGAKCGSVSFVELVSNQSSVSRQGEYSFDDLGRTIDAAVIHHQNLECVEQFSQRGFSFPNSLENDRCLVVSGDYKTDLVVSSGRIHARTTL
jgi:hypothetical protein